MAQQMPESMHLLQGNALPRKELDPSALAANNLLQLTQELQRSMLLDQVIGRFGAHCIEVLSLDGYRYLSEDKAITLASSSQGMHSVEYHLDLEQQGLGTISFTRGKRFQERELATLEQLIGCLIFPLRNAVLFQEMQTAALTDTLTGCGNRRALDDALQREIDLARRYPERFAIAMFDVDHFKSINDQYGHATGDAILKLVVAQVKEQLRVTDLMYRFGGDEFTLLMHGIGAEDALHVAEKIRQAVEELPLGQLAKEMTGADHNEALMVSLSIGVTEFQEDDSINTLCERADQALYLSKSKGRNKTSLM